MPIVPFPNIAFFSDSLPCDSAGLRSLVRLFDLANYPAAKVLSKLSNRELLRPG